MHTVHELLLRLQALPEEAHTLPVELEGCDCVGKWDGTVTGSAPDPYDTPEGSILLGRESILLGRERG